MSAFTGKPRPDYLARLADLDVSGASLRSVVRDLNEAGHRIAWDRQWPSVAVRDMLRRPPQRGARLFHLLLTATLREDGRVRVG
ncbi:MAG: hypothetical protein ACRDUW_15870 [Pseudonocardiaceae bacterium]